MKIISNSAISLDGKINTVEQKPLFLGSKHDLELMNKIRGRADAILVGGKTFRNWPLPSYSIPARANQKPRSKKTWNVIVSNSLNFKFSERYLSSEHIRPLFLTTTDVVPKRFPFEIVRCRTKITPVWIVRQLAKRGVRTLLLEAGGNIITQFLRADLLDEMYLTLTPYLIGGVEAPGLIYGTGFTRRNAPRLQIKSCKRIKDEIFLHAQVNKRRKK